MLKHILALAIAPLASGAWAQASSSYGPPSPKPGAASHRAPVARGALGHIPPYRKQDSLLAANGVKIANGGARRPIASNMELALEPAKGLVDPFGEKKKPMRLLVRVGTRF